MVAFSEEYRSAREMEGEGVYRIVDDEGSMYEFGSAEWGYDEQAAGWDGEGWADDWDD